MSQTKLPQITLVRHGETAWSLSGQHTGRSDIPLTPAGEAAARTLLSRIDGESVPDVDVPPTAALFRESLIAPSA